MDEETEDEHQNVRQNLHGSKIDTVGNGNSYSCHYIDQHIAEYTFRECRVLYHNTKLSCNNYTKSVVMLLRYMGSICLCCAKIVTGRGSMPVVVSYSLCKAQVNAPPVP